MSGLPGTISRSMRQWCRVLHRGSVQWFRAKPWAYTTLTKPPAMRAPFYPLVERMHDLGLFEWEEIVRGDSTRYYRAKLTELGEAVGATKTPDWERENRTGNNTRHHLLRDNDDGEDAT